MTCRLMLSLAILAAPLVGAFAQAEPITKMTYAEAKARIPDREIPAFWVGSLAGLSGRLEDLDRGTTKVVAISPGGRPLHLVTYGDHEPVERLANYNSAIGAREPAAYLDKTARKKPVIFLIGPVHGHEVEALTGLINLIEVMETGEDLRGRDQRALQALGQQCRLLIMPAGNPDGIARFEPQTLKGMTAADLQFWGQGTWSDDRLAGWPGAKRLHPMAGPLAGWLGCYYNDAGINPMHDEFFAPMSSEAPAILKIALEEGPDLATSLHSHGQPPALLRPAYVPAESQERVLALSEQYYALLAERGLPHARPFRVSAEGGANPASFNLTSALHHVSGADAFTFECPHGLVEERYCQVTLEEILDIQLALYETMMRFALEQKEP